MLGRLVDYAFSFLSLLIGFSCIYSKACFGIITLSRNRRAPYTKNRFYAVIVYRYHIFICFSVRMKQLGGLALHLHQLNEFLRHPGNNTSPTVKSNFSFFIILLTFRLFIICSWHAFSDKPLTFILWRGFLSPPFVQDCFRASSMVVFLLFV